MNAAYPQSNEPLHVRQFTTTSTTLTETFPRELRHKLDVETAVFLADGVQYSKLPLDELDFDFRCVATAIETLPNRLFRI
ncbi:transposase [Haloarcula argentinensis DSM 12282]|nr:transposase [Haloarcula argentinensis DSM 12282]